jgi:predicted outer membrane protein
MDRRNALMTLSGVLAASALAAVPSRVASAQTAPGISPVTPLQYKTQTLELGTFSRQTSELALVQARHPKVKQFAQFEVAEQLTMGQVLTDTANPPPAPLTPEHAALLAQLESQVGRGFDGAYLQVQIGAHQELYQAQERFLSGITGSPDYQHIAMLARTVIQMHSTMLEDIWNQLSAEMAGR